MRIDLWQRNLAALLVAQTMIGVGFSFAFPFMPLYVQTLGVQGTAAAAQWAGAISSASAVSMAIAGPFWGNLADRWGRKPMVIRSMVSASVILGIMGFATAPEQLVALRLIQGFLTGTVVATNALAASATPKHRLGFALGVLQVAGFLGNAIGPLVGGIIADTFGFRYSFHASSALMAIAAITVIGFVHEDRTRLRPASADRGVWAESRSLMAMTIFPAMIGVIFLIQLGGNVVSPVLSLFVAELTAGENAATSAGVILTAMGVMSAVSAVFIGRIGDRIGHSTILPICLLGAAISYFPQAFVQQVWQLLLLRMLLGVFLGGLMPTANALVAQMVPPDRRGSVFGLTGTAQSLANAVGPLSGAGIATHWGMRAVFLSTGVLFAFAFGCVTLAFRRLESPHPRPEAGAPGAEPSLARGVENRRED